MANAHSETLLYEIDHHSANMVMGKPPNLLILRSDHSNFKLEILEPTLSPKHKIEQVVLSRYLSISKICEIVKIYQVFIPPIFDGPSMTYHNHGLNFPSEDIAGFP